MNIEFVLKQGNEFVSFLQSSTLSFLLYLFLPSSISWIKCIVATLSNLLTTGVRFSPNYFGYSSLYYLLNN
jgi:hypothetical protein